MLLALIEANAAKQPLGIVLSAAHIHHGLRGAEADADEAFVQELCENLRVPLTVFRVDTAERQASAREGLEEAARELRYKALRGILSEGKADAITTAHTLDDQAETVMMKLLRGAWTEGLGGISPVVHPESEDQRTSIRRGAASGLALPTGGTSTGSSSRFIRPLLGIRRTEVEAYLNMRGQAWRTDSTNANTAFTRNRIRHELMPTLREFNPGIDELLANLAEVARDEESHWQAELSRMLPHLVLPGKPVRGGGRAVGTIVGEMACSVEIERLRGLDAGMRRRMVRAAARGLGTRLNFEETAKLLALAGFGGHRGMKGGIGSKLELHGGFRAERTARELRMWRLAEIGTLPQEL